MANACHEAAEPDVKIERDGEDYQTSLKPHQRLWLGVDNASLCIQRTDQGLVIDVYRKGEEDGEVIAATYVFDAELAADPEQEPA